MEIKSISDLAIYGAYTEASNIVSKLKISHCLSYTDAATGNTDDNKRRYLDKRYSPYLSADHYCHLPDFKDFDSLSTYGRYLVLRNANLNHFMESINDIQRSAMEYAEKNSEEHLYMNVKTGLLELSIISEFIKEIQQETKSLIEEMKIVEPEMDLEY